MDRGHGGSIDNDSRPRIKQHVNPSPDTPAPHRRHRSAHPHSPPAEPAKVSRRRFIAWTAAGAAVVAAGAYGVAEGEASPKGRKQANSKPTDPSTTSTTSTGTGFVSLPISEAILAENAKTGHAWWVTTPQGPGDIEGYASQTSAVAGETVALYVSTKAAQFHVEAYRMGYYQGIGGRLVWQSAPVTGARQADPQLIAPTNTIECQWAPSLSVDIDQHWPPGAYLLKLVGTTGEQQFVPLCVRDDASMAAVVIQHSVTTWQAYNRWGGYSLYYGNADGTFSYTHDPGGGSFEHRARIVSFDRPYDHDWASGAADFVGNELPVIFHAEQLGLDVTYWTDMDLHTRPELLANHKALVSLGHDEYWSAPMRDGAEAALQSGVNFAFLGANACYRQIRFESSPLGPNRRQICYKSATEDPMTGQNDALVTVNWPDSPVLRPESQLIGSTYQDIGGLGDMVITDASSWVFEGVPVTANQALPQVVKGEFDRYVPGGAGPADLDVIAHSAVPNRHGNYSDVTWWTADGGGGVFATGNASWVLALSSFPLIPANVLPSPNDQVAGLLRATMRNVYAVIGSGPASLSQPSTGNWNVAYGAGTGPTPAPVPNNTA
jgi:hypothetical protein